MSLPRPGNRTDAARDVAVTSDLLESAQGRAERAARASDTFFVRIGQIGQATERDERTLPLFPLWLILDADGTLAPECRVIVEQTHC